LYLQPQVLYSLDAPDDERKYRSKHVQQPKNNKFSYTVASCWSFRILYLDARNRGYQINLLLVFRKTLHDFRLTHAMYSRFYLCCEDIGGVEMSFYSFLTSVLDASPSPGRFNPG
jgi:hypothetical protein